MSFPATVFNVLIASPSDVPKERMAIAESLHSWNALNSKDTGKVLLPVMWESHSAPTMGDRPQGIINEQLVRGCDMLIGAFWTRLGSPTGRAASGTVEEINWFMKQKKPVMLYFSREKVDPDSLDTDQWQELRKFRDSLKAKGLLEQYADVNDLTQKLTRQITIMMREISVTSVVDPQAVKQAIKAADKTENDRAEAGTPIVLEDYTPKSFIAVGDTLPWKDEIKEIGGASWTRTRHGFYAWCFTKKKLPAVATLFGLPSDLIPARDGMA
ncbi:hypothetical protein ELH22_21445 [Rhizobium ruizarguesonis]|uniref:hypothetical protein n=1 Tax=Rhizobium ruizarguesonis TaxID=2081791 RepID=UPI001030C35C|nr:hypothetical protein [Rhizobium ruizarguesonis]TBD65707.1 hypothetical protein ELH22_21445 [Rhizobium ruizarguesonis]